MSSRDRCVRTAGIALCLVPVLVVALAAPAHAKTPAHCRDIDFTGAAGAGSQDKVTLRVVAADGITELDRSCLLQVQPSETAIHFAERVVREWGDGTGTLCATTPVPTPTPPLKPVLKKCTAGVNGHSCKKEWVFKTKSDLTIKKKYLRVCCFEASDCTGAKYGKISVGQIPHTLQSKIDPDLVFEPPPTTGPVSRAAAIDPISVVQKPAGGAQGCRNALGKAVAAYASSALPFLGKCRRAETFSPGSCSPAEVAATLAKIGDAFLPVPPAKCPAQGDPSDFGFAPCAPGGTNTCSVGMVGGTCQNDAACDTAPGAGDGVCGDWNQVASCLVGLLENALDAAMDEVWNDVVLGPDVDRCLFAINQTVESLVLMNVAETVACQKKVDGGSLVLPEATPLCRDADVKGVRAAVQGKLLALIGDRCSDMDVALLGVCTPDAATVAGAQACISALADATHRAIVDAVFTEGRPPVCGDGNRTGNEPCDPTAPLPHEQVCRNAAPGMATCTPSCGCPCPTAFDVTLDAADPVSRVERGWTGVDDRESLMSEMRLTLGVGTCEGTERPCGECTLGGPIANVEAGAGAIDNRRCTLDPSVRCTLDAECAPGTCAYYLGPPYPASAGGIGTCYLNQLTGPVTGTVTPETGAVSLALGVEVRPYNPTTVSQPCPLCVGDATPNDGILGGTCSDGARAGLACDANGASPQAAFGTTSLDCPQIPGAALPVQAIKLPLGTGTTTLPITPASPGCTALGFGGQQCPCDTCDHAAAAPCASNADCLAVGAGICGGLRCAGSPNAGQPCVVNPDCPGGLCTRVGAPTAPNACSDGVCTPGPGGTGTCMAGPLDQRCQIETFRSCIVPGDCPLPGDACGAAAPRACFVDPVTASGVLSAPLYDVATPVLAGTTCVGPFSTARNAAYGLPGPLRVRAHATTRNLP